MCTDADARKRGLATRLVRAVAAGIEARGETPILHVLAENHTAIRVYEALGFTTRVAFETLIRPSAELISSTTDSGASSPASTTIVASSR